MVFWKKLNDDDRNHSRAWGRYGAAMALVGSLAVAPGLAVGQNAPSSDTAQLPQRKSSLPREALLKAREAEQHLAANAPEKALEILRDLDRQHPRQPALSLRMAEIYDTMDRHAYALFFYRRYVAQAGDEARPLAVERVSSLELMAGVPEQVDRQVEREFGEDTRPVATPVPRVERMLATRAQDGGLVPIRNEQDLKKLEREGVPKKSPETPVPTITITPIVLPSQTNRPTATPIPTGEANGDQRRDGAATVGDARTRGANEAVQQPVDDEDALLAQAFRKSEETPLSSADTAPENAAMKISAADLAPKVAGDLTSLPKSTPRSRSVAPMVSDANGGQSGGHTAAAASAVGRRNHPVSGTPVSPRLTPAPDNRQMAFISPTPAYTSPRAAVFFNITPAQGQYALVSLINDIPSAVVTLTITPRDDGEVLSAILATSEQKRVYVRPGTYDVMADVSTMDYSPITLMNTHFEYTFTAGQQYTRRFNKNNIQQLN